MDQKFLEAATSSDDEAHQGAESPTARSIEGGSPQGKRSSIGDDGAGPSPSSGRREKKRRAAEMEEVCCWLFFWLPGRYCIMWPLLYHVSNLYFRRVKEVLHSNLVLSSFRLL